MRPPTYDSRRPLKHCENTTLNRQLGVLVEAPYEHRGYTPPVQAHDVSYERPSLNTATFGRTVTAPDKWKPEAAAQTRTIMKHLDEMIAELTEHRTRLKIEFMQLSVRACSIRCIDHPEWGTFGIMEDHGTYFDIHRQGGSRVLDKSEAATFWEIA